MQEIMVNWISDNAGIQKGFVIDDNLAQANLGLFNSMGDLITMHTILMLPENIHKNNFFIGRLCQYLIFTSHCYSGWSMMISMLKVKLILPKENSASL